MSEGKLVRTKSVRYTTSVPNTIKQKLFDYSGFVSIIKELIQNSDDSSKGEKVEIAIDFRDDKLILKNNTFFTNNDWEKIMIIASGNKEDDPNSTGRFGIGFTSVFKICDDFNIHSKGKSWKFELNTLDWIPYDEPRYQDVSVTEFEFFWRKKATRCGDEIRADVLTEENIAYFQKETIESIHKDIYFLNNVVTIEILENRKLKQKIEIDKGESESRIGLPNNIRKEERIITITKSDNSKEILHYLIYIKNCDVHFIEEYKNKITCKKPLLLSIGINKSSLQRGRVFCALPTADYIECLFDLNCDFWPHTNRKSIIKEKDDSKGKYNLKIFSLVPEILLSITEDLKNSLPKTSFYNLLSSFLIKDNNFFKKCSEGYLRLLINSRPPIIFIQDKWLSLNKVKYTEEKYLLSFLSTINSSIVPQEDFQFLPLFKELGIKEFDLNDLIKELKNIPADIELDKSIISTKEELKGIFRYLEYKREDVKKSKSEINRLNIFLTNEGKLINAEICKFYTIPDDLLPLKSDLNLPEIDVDIFKEFEYFLLNTLGIFKRLSDSDLVSKILIDFENKDLPIKLEDSVTYLNKKDKLLIVIDFLDLYIKNYVNSNNKGRIIHNNQVYGPNDRQYESLKSFYNKFEELPLILSSNNLLYPWKNDKVFILKSTSHKKFAIRYNIESINQDILDKIKKYTVYNHLKLKNIIDFVEQSAKNGEKFEGDFLVLLYNLMVEESNQLSESSLKNRIRALPIFVDTEANLCSLENKGKKVFLTGNYNDRFGMAKVLDVKLINSVHSFKENILKNRFGIKELNFEVYVISYFHTIFEDNSIDTDRKLELIRDLSNFYSRIEKSADLQEIKNTLKKTKLIYCKNNQFHYPYDEFIYNYITPAEKEFASMHELEIMQSDVEKMVRKYDLVKGIYLKNVLEYVIDDIGKSNFVVDERYLKILYRIILERVDEIENENFSTIRKLKIFYDTSGNLTTLDNKLLFGDYQLHKEIHIDEILDESIISKVAGFKEKVFIGIFKLELLDYVTFINRYFKLIFENSIIKKEVKLELFRELYTHFAKLEESNLLNLIKNTLVNSKIVYCQDGYFHYPTSQNIFIKSELIDEIFGEDYLYPDFDVEKYKHLFKVLGVKENVEPHQIVDLIKEYISNTEVNNQLIIKMKRLFVSINIHWDNFASNGKDFSLLSDLEWLPASNSSNKLYKPSELYTQSGRYNTRPYLEHLDYIKYLDIKDADLKEKDNRREIKAEFLKLLKLNSIDKIPTSILIDNIEAASKSGKPLTNKMDSLKIYELLNDKISHVEILRLNTFSSIQITYKDDGKPLYFKPSEVFTRRDLQSLFGTEYFGYLSYNYIVKCGNLLNKLGVLEEPNVNNIKSLFEKINKKYESNNLNISNEIDKAIITNSLEYLDKRLNYIEDSFASELKRLPIFCNEKGFLLSADACILEDNPILSQQFVNKLSDYFIKLNVKYSSLIERLEVQSLTELLKKEIKNYPDPLKETIHSDFTQKMQNISKLMPRIIAGNRELNAKKWLIIKEEIKVCIYNDLCVSKYIEWNDKTYYSTSDKINCYLETKNGILNKIYVKGNTEEIRKSLAYELFEEIHPDINQNFMAIISILLNSDSYDSMNRNLTDFLYPSILENSDSRIKNNRIIDENTFEDNSPRNDYLSRVKETTEEVMIPNTINVKLDSSDIFDYNIENADVKETETFIIKRKENTEDIMTIEVDNSFEKLDNPAVNDQSVNINTPKVPLQSIPTNQKDILDHNKGSQKKTYNQIKNEKDKIPVTQCLTSFEDDKVYDFDPQISDEEEEEVNIGRSMYSTHKTNFKKKLSEKYCGKHSKELKKDEDFNTSRSLLLEDIIPRSLEDNESFIEKTREEISFGRKESNLVNKSRGYSPRLDLNKDDDIADLEIRIWYEGKCQICGRTFKKEGSDENYSEVINLLEIQEQGVTHTANKVCLCPYHAAILKHGEIKIHFDDLVNNELDATIFNEYENGYRDINCRIKYNEIHFLQLKALLSINNI